MTERRRKIDNTLKERHGILRLLERLKCDTLSLAELEEIGDKLQKSGARALSPLVRRLWREKSGDLMARYAYLLDFFDDSSWLDQLIQIAIRRKDLETEGKVALLGLLDDCGIDVNSPPFASLLADFTGDIRESLPRLLDKGEEGLVCCVEELLLCTAEQRAALIEELPRVTHPLIVELLEILALIDDKDSAAASIKALGRIRDGEAAAALGRIAGIIDSAETEELLARSSRRLSFMGIAPTLPTPPPTPPLPVYAAYASPFDGTGNRSCCVARWHGDQTLAVAHIHLHEKRGVLAAWCEAGLPVAEFQQRLEELVHEEGVVEVPLEYAMLLVNDAIYRNREAQTFLPAELYVRRGILTSGCFTPLLYEPEPAHSFSDDAERFARHIKASASLLDHDYFAGWFLASGRIYDFAEEWTALEQNEKGDALGAAVEEIIARCCREVVLPDTELLSRRLLLTADLMRQTSQPLFLVERTAATARSLAAPSLHLHRHPFIKRLVLESMDVAREALAEGYDIRLNNGDEEWD
jgi:hypothetical protein